MNIKVTMDNAKLRQLERAAAIALEKTAEAVKTEVINAQVMPFDTGTMQNTGMNVETAKSGRGEVSINVDTPYARRVYYHPEINFQTVNNPNARGEWFEPWINGEHKDFAQNAFNKLYKKEAGL